MFLVLLQPSQTILSWLQLKGDGIINLILVSSALHIKSLTEAFFHAEL